MLPSTRPVLRALEQTYRHPAPPQRTPRICPTCQQTQLPRPFTTTPPRRSSPPQPQEKPPPPPSPPPPRSHYTLFPQTFPAGPPPATPFSPNLAALRREFLTLQQRSHPDVAPSRGLKAAYEAQSAAINDAYRTLQDPLRRAQYLLAQAGIDVEDESAKLGSEGEGGAGLLAEVMEAREAVEEVQGEEELVGLRRENQTRIEGSVAVLEEAFARGELPRAATEAVRLRYWMNIEESIRGWEKGRGGGLVHH